MEAVRNDDRPLAVDLFAGAGGLALGFEQAGFEVAAAVEIDPIHCAVHKFNFPRAAVIARSITELSGDDIRAEAGIGAKPVATVFGGSPCQGFSMIGQRSLDDPRNGLVLDFVRIVKELDAETFVFENVKGLTVGRQAEFLNEIVRAFGEAGYDVRLPWRVLDAADFGVPQHRERLFLLGAKKGSSKLPLYPAQTTVPADEIRLNPDLPVGPTCVDALGDLPNADLFKTLIETDAVRTTRFGKPSAYSSALRGLSNDSWRLGHPRVWDATVMTSSARTEHTQISRRRFAETSPGAVEPVSRFFKLSPDGLSNTLRAGTDSARGAFTSPRPIHYEHPRCVTVREMARLQGFPDWFRFHATKWHGARQIGNSVPPPLAFAVGRAVISALGCNVLAPSAAIDLGDPKLLTMDMSEAADHFGVPRIIGRRDRKSGARKRSQAEIEAARAAAAAYA